MITTREFGPVTQFTMGRLFGGKPVYTMACYYVDGLLIDTGPAHVAEEIPAALAPYPVRTVVNTHHHEDHIGNNAILQQQFGTGPALAHPLAVPRISNPASWASRLLPYQHFAWGSPPASAAAAIPDRLTVGRHRYAVIYTPGHSDDHICLLEPDEGWLFTGDLFLSERAEVLRSDEDAGQILASLRRLLDYEFKTIFCGSGRVVEDGKRALAAKVEFWEHLATEACRLRAEGREPEEIRQALLGEESTLYHLTGGDFGKIHLINSLLRCSCPDAA